MIKNGFPRKAIEIIENCWFDIDRKLSDLRELWIGKKDPDIKQEFYDTTNFLRAEASKLNKILKDYFGVRLITKRTGLYRLDPHTPKYCIIKMNNSKKEIN